MLNSLPELPASTNERSYIGLAAVSRTIQPAMPKNLLHESEINTILESPELLPNILDFT